MDVPIVKLWKIQKRVRFCYQFIIFSMVLFFTGASLLVGYMETAIDDVLTLEEQQSLYHEISNAPMLPEILYQAYDLSYPKEQQLTVWEHFYNMGSLNRQGYSKCIYSEIFDHYLVSDRQVIHRGIAAFIVALELEEKFTRKQCVNALMAQQDFLMNSIGVKKAARNYFNKTLGDISLEEAIILVNMTKNPVLYRREALALAEKN